MVNYANRSQQVTTGQNRAKNHLKCQKHKSGTRLVHFPDISCPNWPASRVLWLCTSVELLYITKKWSQHKSGTRLVHFPVRSCPNWPKSRVLWPVFPTQYFSTALVNHRWSVWLKQKMVPKSGHNTSLGHVWDIFQLDHVPTDPNQGCCGLFFPLSNSVELL